MPEVPVLLAGIYRLIDHARVADDGKEMARLRLTAEVDNLRSEIGGHVKIIEDLEAENKRLLGEPGDLEQQLVASGEATEKVRLQCLQLETRSRASERGLRDANYEAEERIGELEAELKDSEERAEQASERRALREAHRVVPDD
jgi:chromosome segregation ATPase